MCYKGNKQKQVNFSKCNILLYLRVIKMESHERLIQVRDLISQGQVTVLAGRPGMGKTSLARDLISISNHKTMPAYVTLYEDSDSIIERFAQRSIPCSVFTSLPLAFEMIERSFLTAPCLVIDYIPINESGDLRETFQKLREYAQTHQAPVLVLSQLSRKIETRRDKHPLLRDLPAPMQDCLDLIDNVIMLFREGYYSGENTDKAEVIFVKGSGEKTIPLTWDGKQATFL